MKKEISFVKGASDILKLKKKYPEKINDDLIRMYVNEKKFENEKERMYAIKGADLALKLKSKENLPDKKIIQKVLDTLN